MIIYYLIYYFIKKVMKMMIYMGFNVVIKKQEQKNQEITMIEEENLSSDQDQENTKTNENNMVEECSSENLEIQIEEWIQNRSMRKNKYKEKIKDFFSKYILFCKKKK